MPEHDGNVLPRGILLANAELQRGRPRIAGLTGIEDDDPDYDIMNLETPVQFWKILQPDSLIQLMVDQSKLYTTQKQTKLGKFSDLLTAENMRLIQGILLVMGYNKVPSRRFY